jgi:type III restriction enzyme
MSRYVNAISGRLSLRHPQRASLEILHRITEIAPPKHEADVKLALAAIQSEYPSVEDFEREFPSLCFALATGVGKTRLMGAFVSYLHLEHGIDNFFVLAPNLTIYNKLIADFTPGTPKYVFKGINEFAVDPPLVITGDNYETQGGSLLEKMTRCRINIFNISKINSEVRGGKAPRIKRLSEYLGQSYFEYLAAIPDLVMIMDESHRYRASAGIRAINELKPVLGLELTATPFVETSKGPVAFKNVIYDYPLGRAMVDGFVKEPAVVTRQDFNPSGMTPAAIETLKLEDGVRLHESLKVELTTYARQSGKPLVKPFMLVIARDTTHAGQLLEMVTSDAFFDGRYKEKAIQVDSSRTGSDEEEMIERLLKVEHADEPTEIVIHVNMLKEGWDVTNLYTIVPLRAANARTLIEQSIGRGLRLPYGVRTGVAAVDRLNIVAHDKFQEIVDEANRPGSQIRMTSLVIDPDELARKKVTVVSAPILSRRLGIRPSGVSGVVVDPDKDRPAVFSAPSDKRAAELTLKIIREYESRTDVAPGSSALTKPEVRAEIVREVAARFQPDQLEIEGVAEKPDFEKVVAVTTEQFVNGTIDIPRILVIPRGDVAMEYRPFTLDLSSVNYPAVADDLWVQHLRTGEREVLSLGQDGRTENRLEDYIVGALLDKDDIAYEHNADLLYDLARQVVERLASYLPREEVAKVLRVYQRALGDLVHGQMQEHRVDSDVEYDVTVSKGFTELKEAAYSHEMSDEIRDFRASPPDKSNMARYLFGGFDRGLYSVEQFQSDPERKLAIILDRETLKWFKPRKGQFQIFYREGVEEREYQPDFVAETADSVYMLEPKAANKMEDKSVLAKKTAAAEWCARATEYTSQNGGKPWRYALIPHDAIAENMTVDGLMGRFGG